MADLTREQREVIELGFFSGHSHAQIAERLGAPLGTVKKRMRTGLKRLRVALDGRFAESISP
jgi:RNA polymerase sigma-70 factor (ECF subfamily)